MQWNNHYDLAGKHAVISPSNYSWQNYDRDKMYQVFTNQLRKQDGTRLHELASEMIKLRVKPAPHKKALNQFVLDAIGLDMASEQLLFYSYNCFGTADAIKYDEENKFLRIHDLKTGVTKVSFKQLYAYAALFCLEYNKNPYDLQFELRLYQGRDIMVEQPDPSVIQNTMTKIVELDEAINDVRKERKESGID